jgi:hypothetical protein
VLHLKCRTAPNSSGSLSAVTPVTMDVSHLVCGRLCGGAERRSRWPAVRASSMEKPARMIYIPRRNIQPDQRGSCPAHSTTLRPRPGPTSAEPDPLSETMQFTNAPARVSPILISPRWLSNDACRAEFVINSWTSSPNRQQRSASSRRASPVYSCDPICPQPCRYSAVSTIANAR